MRETTGRPVVLIVDSDLGFVCWLAELLARSGCQSIPALNSRDAVRLVTGEKVRIEMVIVDPGLPGANEVIRLVCDKHPSFKTIAVRTPCHDEMEQSMRKSRVVLISPGRKPDCEIQARSAG